MSREHKLKGQHNWYTSKTVWRAGIGVATPEVCMTTWFCASVPHVPAILVLLAADLRLSKLSCASVACICMPDNCVVALFGHVFVYMSIRQPAVCAGRSVVMLASVSCMSMSMDASVSCVPQSFGVARFCRVFADMRMSQHAMCDKNALDLLSANTMAINYAIWKPTCSRQHSMKG